MDVYKIITDALLVFFISTNFLIIHLNDEKLINSYILCFFFYFQEMKKICNNKRLTVWYVHVNKTYVWRSIKRGLLVYMRMKHERCKKVKKMHNDRSSASDTKC